MRRKRRQLTAAQKRALALSPGLVVTQYTPDGEHAEIRQLSPESDERRRSFARRLSSADGVNEERGA